MTHWGWYAIKQNSDSNPDQGKENFKKFVVFLRTFLKEIHDFLLQETWTVRIVTNGFLNSNLKRKQMSNFHNKL